MAAVSQTTNLTFKYQALAQTAPLSQNIPSEDPQQRSLSRDFLRSQFSLFCSEVFSHQFYQSRSFEFIGSNSGPVNSSCSSTSSKASTLSLSAAPFSTKPNVDLTNQMNFLDPQPWIDYLFFQKVMTLHVQNKFTELVPLLQRALINEKNEEKLKKIYFYYVDCFIQIDAPPKLINEVCQEAIHKCKSQGLNEVEIIYFYTCLFDSLLKLQQGDQVISKFFDLTEYRTNLTVPLGICSPLLIAYFQKNEMAKALLIISYIFNNHFSELDDLMIDHYFKLAWKTLNILSQQPLEATVREIVINENLRLVQGIHNLIMQDSIMKLQIFQSPHI